MDPVDVRHRGVRRGAARNAPLAEWRRARRDADEGNESVDANGYIRNVETPTITVYLPDQRQGYRLRGRDLSGGAYWLLAANHEGSQIAEWLNSIGVAGIILKYRHVPFKHPIP